MGQTRLLSLVTKPPYEDSLAFEWWLGGDKPLDPYIRGQLFSILVDRFRPRDLRVGDCYESLTSLELELAERTVLQYKLDSHS